MPRVKGGYVTRQRRNRTLKLAKGYFGSKHALYRTANEQVMHSMRYAFRDRRQLKREMRKLWIARINAAAKNNDINYSNLMHGLKLAGINLNRKMLSEIAIHDPEGFKSLVDDAKKAIADKKTAPALEIPESTYQIIGHTDPAEKTEAAPAEEKPAEAEEKTEKPAAKKTVKKAVKSEDAATEEVKAVKKTVKKTVKKVADKAKAAEEAPVKKAVKKTVKKAVKKDEAA